MIPILYSASETAFNSNGIARLAECVSCEVTEERNGIYECQFVYPISGASYGKIQEGCVIACRHDETTDIQPFDIYARSTPINGLVTFYAHHISYRLGNVILKPFTATSCAEAMARMTTENINENPFEFWTDKQTVANFTVSEPISVKALFGGMQGSLIDIFGGGEYEFDRWTVKLHEARGIDTGIQIRYGKNLTDMTQEYDDSGSYNAVVPYWANEDTIVTVPGYIVSIAETVGQPQRLTTMDLSQEFSEAPTAAQLEAKARSLMSQNESWLASENIEVDFVALWQTKEYERFAPLQRVRLCDKVDIIAPELNVVKMSKKVVKTVFDVLIDRYSSIELGTVKTSFSSVIQASTEGVLKKTFTTRSYVDAAVTTATDRIAGALGGYVVINRNANGEPTEILIMDTDDIETAVNVLRINMAGIGFSENGYGGPYTSAWTLDGAFVADFITTGTLNANLLRAGIITDTLGQNYWNLESGELLISVANVSGAASVTQLEAAIDDISIGGRNLMIGTLNPQTEAEERPHIKGQTTNTGGRGTCTVAEHGIRMTTTSANWAYIYFGASSNSSESLQGVIPGETYTFSADCAWRVLSADDSEDTSYIAFRAYSRSDGGTFREFAADNVAAISQSEKGVDGAGRIELTFTVPDDAIAFFMGLSCVDHTAAHYSIGDYVELSNIKFETGNLATAWTPAPEDVDETISDVDAKAETALETADDANETAENVRNWMKFTSDGLSMGKDGSTYSTLVDDVGFHVLQSGEKITTIAKRRVAAEEFRVGKLNSDTRCVLREAGDGGIIITPEAF